MAETKVFISYARRDGKTLANRLRDDLITAGYDVWLDTSEIEGGASWSAEIETAIEDCQITLALLSEASFGSEICRAEHLRSLRKGKRVIPLLVQMNAERPLYLEHLNYRDFSDMAEYANRLAELLEDITSGTSAALPTRYRHTVVTNAPARPPNFLPRPEVLDTLRQMVTSDSSDRRIAITALQGMGGIGKSVMAAVLCHDSLIQDAYPDGVVWLTIGREPGSMALKLRRLLEALGAAVESNADEEKMIDQLRTLLPGKAALIVLDDVWDAEHLKPFIVENTPGARLLFTTRDSALATATDATLYQLDALSDIEALHLLAQWVNTSPDALPETAQQVAAECGNLPLALALCGAQVRDGERWDDLLAALREADLEFLDHPHGSVMKSIKVSLDALERESDIYARHYRELSVFPEDEAVPEAAVMTLWLHTNGINERNARRLITTLSNRALILTSGESPNRQVELHDLQHRYLRSVLGDLHGAHNELLEAYRKKCPAGWASGPNDGYFFEHLAYHLYEAGSFEDFHSLFANQDWMEVRFNQAHYTYDGYLQDLMIAWKDAAHPQALAQIEAGEEPAALADCVRYALIHTSINSVAGNYVPELVARAVETGLWTVEQAFDIAKRMQNPEKRTALYIHLLETHRLDSTQRSEASVQGLESMLVSRRIIGRSRVFAALAPHLDSRLLQQRLPLELARSDAWERVLILEKLAPLLTEDLLRYGMMSAAEIQDKEKRVEAFAALIPQLDEVEKTKIVSQEFETAIAIEEEEKLSSALETLAPWLKGDLLQRGLKSALEIKNEWYRVKALMALAPHLEEESRKVVFRRGLEATLGIIDAQTRIYAFASLASRLSGIQKTEVLHQALEAMSMLTENNIPYALMALAPHLEDDLLCQGLNTALTISYEPTRSLAIIALAPYLGKDLLSQGLQATLALGDEETRFKALAALGPRLSDDLLHIGLEAVITIQRENHDVSTSAAPILHWNHRIDALAALVPCLEREQKTMTLHQGLEMALGIQHEMWRSKALATLAPYLEGDLLCQGLDAALVITDKVAQIHALASLSFHIEDEQRADILRQELMIALSIADEHDRVSALTALAPRLTGDLLFHGMEAALALSWEGNQGRVLAALAPQLEGDLLQRGLEVVLTFQNESIRAETLAALAPQLTDDLLKQGLDAIFAIRGNLAVKEQALALAAVVPQLEGEQKAEALYQGIETAFRIRGHAGIQTRVLTALAPYLEEQQKAEISRQKLNAILSFDHDDYDRARELELVALGPLLTKNTVNEALEIAFSLSDELYRTRALAAIAPHLIGNQKTNVLHLALEAALAISNASNRKEALVALAPQLTEELARQAIDAILESHNRGIRREVLAALAPRLTGDLVRQGLEIALTLYERERGEILAALVPRLTGDLVRQGLEAVLTLTDEWSRSRTFGAFFPVCSNTDFLKDFRWAVASFLLLTQNSTRNAVLWFCYDKTLLAPPVISPTTVATIAHSIGEICRDWKWL